MFDKALHSPTNVTMQTPTKATVSSVSRSAEHIWTMKNVAATRNDVIRTATMNTKVSLPNSRLLKSFFSAAFHHCMNFDSFFSILNYCIEYYCFLAFMELSMISFFFALVCSVATKQIIPETISAGIASKRSVVNFIGPNIHSSGGTR